MAGPFGGLSDLEGKLCCLQRPFHSRLAEATLGPMQLTKALCRILSMFGLGTTGGQTLSTTYL
jgi:hypothetical protein